jgi:polysaccharide pyruvyl transferase WcaK-like protein
MKRVLVQGFYYHSNIGDQLFIDAFYHLFPDLHLTFVDHIEAKDLINQDAVFIGGGSFLQNIPEIDQDILEQVNEMKHFYLGVGVEKEIHPIHQQLMQSAQLVAIRSPNQIERVKLINPNSILIPDLVYSLQDQVEDYSEKQKAVLIIPNSNVLPQNKDPHWKHISWQNFKSEFSQFLDWLIENGYRIDFMPFDSSNKTNDVWAATELISQMNHRDNKYVLKNNEGLIYHHTSRISRYQVVITQRFHGIVLAEMSGVPCIALHHHDKLQDTYSRQATFLSYYGCYKQKLIDNFTFALETNVSPNLSLFSNVFETMKKEVIALI